MASTYSTVFSRDDIDLIVEFAGCSLDEKPGSNWVQESGGLPEYICRIAKAIKKTGKSTSQAIAIAVSRVKKWAAGADGVDADTKAKAAKAVAEWERLKAKGGKSKKVAASRTDAGFLMLANVSSFNVDMVRSAWQLKVREARRAWSKANPTAPYDEGPASYSYIKEMWSDFLIVSGGDYEQAATFHKVPYTVDKAGEVTFGSPAEVKTQYVVVKSGDLAGDEITDTQLQAMTAAVPPCNRSATDQVLLSIAARQSAVEQVIGWGRS